MVPTSRASFRPLSLVRLGSVPTDAEDDLEFLQQRLALYFGTVALLSSLFLIVGVLSHFLFARDYFQEPSRPTHIAATAVAAFLWFVARSRHTFTLNVLNWLDLVGTMSICLLFAAMGHSIPAISVGTLVGLLAVSYVTLARAAQLPSTPGRTLVLTAFAFSSLVVSSLIRPIGPEYPQSLVGRVFSTLDPALWSVAGTALATVASRVIYGLQEKVMEARQLGQYTLEEKIGEGGMGEIYRAQHAMLRRPTAIKLLPGDHSETQLRRFEREVRLTASLSHPNTICVFDYGRTPDNTFYYAMELLRGLNLEALVERYGAQPPGRVVNILRQVCGSLSEAHGVGLIHRDIKPANIYLCQHGGIEDFVKVLDFGLVRQLKGDIGVSQSNVQVLVGTPLYMAPEAITAPDSIDARSDLYSLGAAAYYLLTGAPPFTGSSVVEVCGHHLHSEPEPPSRRSKQPIPAFLERIVLDCLAKNPADRPESAIALSRLLEHQQDVKPYTPEDAKHFWQHQFTSVERQPAVTDKTIRVALSERMANSAWNRKKGAQKLA